MWRRALFSFIPKFRKLIAANAKLCALVGLSVVSIRHTFISSAANSEHYATSFINSVASGDIELVKKFIENQIVDVNVVHPCGWSALMVASSNGNRQIVEILLENGANPNAQDEYPGTLHPRFNGRNNLQQVLREREICFKKFDPFQDFRGFTPLHYAAFRNQEEIIDILVSHGADATILSSAGLSPLDVAMNSNTLKKLESYLDTRRKEAEKIALNERRKYPLAKLLKENIVGQRRAIQDVSKAIRRVVNGWTSDEKPLVMMFLGSSGVGKTAVAKLIAKYLHNNTEKFIRIDMSEYGEKHQVARMIGSPPGYVGHEEGGQLTTMLKKHPDAVVLLDELEKAHPDVLNILLALFDEGRITDGKGETVQTNKAIFIMTSNLANDIIRKYADEGLNNDYNQETIEIKKHFIDTQIYPVLKKNLKRDEFLGRIDEMVYFLPFSKKELELLVELELQQWTERIKKKHNITLTYAHEVLHILSEAYDSHYGARSLKAEVERKVISVLAEMEELDSITTGDTVHISVDYDDEGNSIKLLYNVYKGEQNESGLYAVPSMVANTTWNATKTVYNYVKNLI